MLHKNANTLGPQKILVHDYSGHAFTAQLGRGLAARGHEVIYVSFNEFGTPKGRVKTIVSDPPNFRSEEISINASFDKDNLIRRHRQQIEYAIPAANVILRERPSIVLSGNSPPEVQARLLRAARTVGAKFAFWMQDINAEAIGRILGRRSPLLGKLAGGYYKWLERGLLQKSDRIIVISDDFKTVLVSAGWDLPHDKVDVVENWAPLGDIPLHPRDNDWTAINFRPGRLRIVYSGTLARKHDPEILVRLAQELDVDVHLFSQGSGAEHVDRRRKELKLDNLFVRPWVTVDELPMMLAGADVLCAFIEKDAGAFSVPSKVLSYLSAGRPILASIPAANLATRTIRSANAGLVSDPGDHEAMLENARRLIESSDLRDRLGHNGRAYAERVFDIERIAGRFEKVFEKAAYANASDGKDASTTPSSILNGPSDQLRR